MNKYEITLQDSAQKYDVDGLARIRAIMSDGRDGVSPVAKVTKSGNTATITITDATGTTSASVSDGVTPTASVTKAGDTSTITITDTEGTTSASVTDGYSPTASVERIDGGVQIEITDKNGTTTERVYDGDVSRNNPVKTASGTIVSFDDGAANAPIEDLTVTMLPRMTDGVYVSHTSTTISHSAYGRNFLRSDLMVDQSTWHPFRLYLEPNTQYVAWTDYDGGELLFYATNSTTVFGAGNKVSASHPVVIQTLGDGVIKIQQRRTSEAVSFSSYKFQIEKGSSPTVFYPYGDHYAISWGDTAGAIYGGVLDVTGGTITVTHAYADLSSLRWSTRYTGETNKTLSCSLPSSCVVRGEGFFLDAEQYQMIGSVSSINSLKTPDSLSVGLRYYFDSNLNYTGTIYLVLPNDSSPTGGICWKQYEPVTYQIEPTEIRAKEGRNTIWAQRGDTSLAYRVDMTKYTEQQLCKALPNAQANGPVVTITDGADHVRVASLLVPIDMRINGRTGLTISSSRKNLADQTRFLMAKNWKYIDGEYRGPSSELRTLFGNGNSFLWFGGDDGVGIVTVSANYRTPSDDSANHLQIIFSYTDGTSNTMSFASSATTVRRSIVSKDGKSVRGVSFTYGTGAQIALSDFQIELGSEATEFEPYSGDIVTIDWSSEAGTVYGGTFDATTGLLTVNYAKKTIHADDLLKVEAGRALVSLGALGSVVWGVGLSNMLQNYTGSQVSGLQPGQFVVYNSDAYRRAQISFIFEDVALDTDSYRQKLQELDDAGTPLEVVYQTTEAKTYQLSPAEIRTELGFNHIWAGCGALTMAYYADPTIRSSQQADSSSSEINQLSDSLDALSEMRPITTTLSGFQQGYRHGRSGSVLLVNPGWVCSESPVEFLAGQTINISGTLQYHLVNPDPATNGSELLSTRSTAYTFPADLTAYVEIRYASQENITPENVVDAVTVETAFPIVAAVKQMSQRTNSFVKYVSTTGNDSNDGNTSSTPYATIWKAISETPDVIYIARGTYSGEVFQENTNYRYRGVTIIADHATVIGPSAKLHFRFADVHISGLNIDITGTTAESSACFHLFNCTGSLTDCTATGAIGAGGFRLDGSKLTLTRCKSYGNGIDGFNAHDLTDGYSSECTFVDCEAYDNADDGLSFHENGKMHVFGGKYYNNGSAGIAPHQYCDFEIRNAVIYGNGAGIECYNPSYTDGAEKANGVIIGCIVTGNNKVANGHAAADIGYGIHAKNYTVQALCNAVSGNNSGAYNEDSGATISILSATQ